MINSEHHQKCARTILSEKRQLSRALGSGSHEAGGPFQIVAMEKETQATIMHHEGF